MAKLSCRSLPEPCMSHRLKTSKTIGWLSATSFKSSVRTFSCVSSSSAAMTSPWCSESCPNVGSIEMYERHCALENHLFYGKYKFLPVRETLVDKAKVPHNNVTEILPQGWALRSSKKSTRFSEPQWWYMESKFKLGQET